MAEQRLPIVNSDDGVWGDIIRQYLEKEHLNDDTDNPANGGHKNITIAASNGVPGTAPITIEAGTLISSEISGTIEFDGYGLYATLSTSGDATRRTVANIEYGATGTLGDLMVYNPNPGGIGSKGGMDVFATGSNGQTLQVIGGVPAWGTSGSITWQEITGTSQTAVVNKGYITNNASLVTITLPTTAAVGDIVEVSGKGAGGWKIAQNASEIIHFGMFDTTTGTGGYIASTHRRDAVKLVCVVADTEWNVAAGAIGNIDMV